MLPIFEITSYRVVEKYTTHIRLKKNLTSYQKVFHANESAESYIYCLEHYVHAYRISGEGIEVQLDYLLTQEAPASPTQRRRLSSSPDNALKPGQFVHT